MPGDTKVREGGERVRRAKRPTGATRAVRSPVQIPEGVSDIQGRIAAVSRAEGDVDILDLECGARLRTLAGAGRPLMIDDGALIGCKLRICRPPQMTLWRLWLADGSARSDGSVELPLPEWIAEQSLPAAMIRVGIERRGDVYSISWTAKATYTGGAPPPRHLDERARRSDSARMDVCFETLQSAYRSDADASGDVGVGRSHRAGAVLVPCVYGAHTMLVRHDRGPMHVGIAEQCEMRVNALSDESIRQDVVKVPVAHRGDTFSNCKVDISVSARTGHRTPDAIGVPQ